MYIPRERSRLLPFIQETVEQCRRSAGMRAAYCRALKTYRDSGSANGNPAILNRLQYHIKRKAGYLFSPNNLRFSIDFEHIYPQSILAQAKVASRTLTRIFERRNIDFAFRDAVPEALTFGGLPLKLLWGPNGVDARLVMPWQFGVYREELNDLADQEAMVETNRISMYDVWRRVSHLPGGRELFKRALSHARTSSAVEEDGPYLHQILLSGSSPMVQTDPSTFASVPGGMMQIAVDPAGAVLAPEATDNMVTMHELWVIDDDRQDYTTLQLIEPDIVIAPVMKRKNLFVPDYHPYVMVQPNRTPGYFWGRSDLADLLKLQSLLKDRMADKAKLMSLEYDRILAFIGQTTMNDELYDQFKRAGWMQMDTGDIKDLTPKLPEKAFEDIQEIMKMMDEVSGFANILSGEGEPGVRAGNHAQMLLKTASPSMRDMALLVERQCADAGDKVYELLAAKEAKAYWDHDGSEFLLSQIPEDRRVGVDSHSSSPIYEDDHQQQAAFLVKAGFMDGEEAIEAIWTGSNKDQLKDSYRIKQQKQAEMLQQHPEMLKELMHGHKGGKK